MKRLIIIIGILCCALNISAQSVLNILEKKGNVTSFSFSEKPKITYTPTDLVINTTTTSIEFPLSSLSKLTFSDSDVSDGIESVIVNSGDDKSVEVFNTHGQLVKRYKKNATSAISFDNLPAGLYIIKTKNKSYKISKK